MTPLALVLAAVVASPGSAAVGDWEWAVSELPPPASAWRSTAQPFVQLSPGAPHTLWLRTQVPSAAPEAPLALLLGYQASPFEVRVGERLVHHYPGSRREAPWHLVDLPRDAAGQPLVLKVQALHERQRVLGFTWGVRLGTRADHYLWMLRSEWRVAALALGLLAVALVSLGAHVAARLRRQSRPFGALAALCAATGLFLIPQRAGYLAALLLPRQDLLDLCNTLALALVVLSELWYVRAVYQRPLRFGLVPLAWAMALFVAAFGLGSYLWGLELPSYGRIQRLLSLGVAALTLANIAAFWPSCSRALRFVSLGLVVYELNTLAQMAAAELGVSGPPVDMAYVGFVVFLFFVLASMLVVSFEARLLEDQERERNAHAHAVAQTTAMFAHDVRKPFAIMRMSLQSLRAARTMEEVSEALDIAGEEVEQVTGAVDEMIADILGAGTRDAPRPAEVDLGECLARVLATLDRLGDARDLTLDYALEHTRLLRCDGSRLERVLTNLVANAVEAMHGQGRIWFHSRDLERSGRARVEVTVGNDNASISGEHLERVFDPFFTTGKRGGTGLGLTIVKKIIQSQGGTIRCRSSADKGVEFVFRLPAAQGPARRAAVLPPRMGDEQRRTTPAPLAAVSAPGGHVVLVEDSRAVRLAWRRRLPENTLRDFESPAHCLAAAASDPRLLTEALLVVLDNRFGPGEMEGIALGELLRARTRAPLLLCSGVPLGDLPSWCDGQLAKDTYDLDELRAAAQRLGERPR